MNLNQSARESTVSDFNLRALVRDVAQRSTIRDPDQLAEAILREIPEANFLDALKAAIKPLVREVISGARPHGTFTTGYGSPQQQPAISAPRGGSMKVTAIRDGWQEHLHARYSVSEGYKFLGECTYEDLQFIAGRLDRQAEMHASKARGMRSLAALLTEHDAKTVRDLPAATLMLTLGAAA